MLLKKNYGIYLAYPPTVDLRDQGLGRHLAAFLKGAIEHNNVQFVLVCPSWSKESIFQLMQAEDVPLDAVEIVAPEGEPALLKLYYLYARFRKLTKRKKNESPTLSRQLAKGYYYLKSEVTYSKNLPQLLFFSLPLLFVALIYFISKSIEKLMGLFTKKTRTMKWLDGSSSLSRRLSNTLALLFDHPKNSQPLHKIYKKMEEYETNRMLKLIDGMNQVSAWYSPTAFWPSFNQIKAPRLICVPDLVLAEFPIGFAELGGTRFLDTFRCVEQTIYGGSHFVTYSNHIKQTVLIDNHGKTSDQVDVVMHAPNSLQQFLSESGHNEPELANRFFFTALKKSSNPEYADGFQNQQVKFIFYASQFRPSKNVLTLLRSYHHLLRNRFLPYKLILTGKPDVMSEIDDYILQHHLEKDVLLLSGLSVEELAACYKLAVLAVNPSLSEGGCPFTFTEALSVNTPVLMANIPVSQEVLTDPHLQEITFFDPYCWKSLAAKIEWALANRELLLSKQLDFYQGLLSRSWQDVVNGYIEILDKIAMQKGKNTEKFNTDHVEYVVE